MFFVRVSSRLGIEAVAAKKTDQKAAFIGSMTRVCPDYKATTVLFMVFTTTA